MKKYIPDCQAKKHFDTEFEATIGAVKASSRYNVELIVYKCGPHYHLTNADPSQRGKHRKYYRCPHCKQVVNQKKNPTHYGRCKLKP